MRQPTKTFRLSSTAKAMCATILDPHERGNYRRAMIDAEMASSESVKRDRPDPKGNSPKA